MIPTSSSSPRLPLSPLLWVGYLPPLSGPAVNPWIVGVKFLLFLYCFAARKGSSQVQMLWEDHRNDLFVNGFGKMDPVPQPPTKSTNVSQVFSCPRAVANGLGVCPPLTVVRPPSDATSQSFGSHGRHHRTPTPWISVPYSFFLTVFPIPADWHWCQLLLDL